MADRDFEFRIRLNSDGTLTGELKKAKAAAADFGKTVDKAGRQANAGIGKVRTGVQSISHQLNLAKKQLIAFFGVQQALRGGKKILALADDYTLLNARLKLVTDSQEEFERAQAGTYATAQQTRTALGATVDLYQRLARSTRDVIKDQDRLLVLTRAINQSMIVSGATTEESAASLIQLGQGLRSGQLQGEELRSVLENSGRLAQAIADGMGVNVGQLRTLAAQGQLTTEVVVKAIESQAAKINEEYERMPRTVGQAITEISNAWTRYIGRVDKANSVTRKLADRLHDVAENLDRVIESAVTLVKIGLVLWFSKWALKAVAAAGAIKGLAGSVKLLAAAVIGYNLGEYFYTQFEVVRGTAAAMIGNVHGYVEQLAYFFKTIPLALKSAWYTALNTIRSKVANWADDIANLLSKIPGVGDTAADAVHEASNALRQDGTASVKAVRDEIGALEREHTAAMARIKASTKAAIKSTLDKPANTGSGLPAPGDGGNGTPPPDLKAINAHADAELDLLKAKTQSAIAELDRMRERDLLSVEAYIRKRLALEQQALDAEIANKRRELATTKKAEDREELLGQIQVLEVKRAELAKDADHQILLARKELTDQLLQLQSRLLEAQGHTAEARLLELETEFKATVKHLTAEGDQAGIELAQRLFRTEVARTQLDEMVRQYQAAQARMRDEEQRIQLDLDSGLITQTDAQRQIVALHQSTARELEQQIPLMEELAGILGPSAQAEVRRFGTEIAKLKVPLSANLQAVKNDFKGAFKDAFTSITHDINNAGDAVRNLGRSLLDIVQSRILDQLATQLTDLLFTSGGSGGFNLTTALTTILPGVFHGGGEVTSSPKSTRAISPLVFAGAPRFHNGSGVLGLKSDEMPAILQKGERVQSRQEVRDSARADASNRGVRILNVIDPSLVRDYMTSGAGEDTILNVLSRRRGDVQAILS